MTTTQDQTCCMEQLHYLTLCWSSAATRYDLVRSTSHSLSYPCGSSALLQTFQNSSPLDLNSAAFIGSHISWFTNISVQSFPHERSSPLISISWVFWLKCSKHSFEISFGCQENGHFITLFAIALCFNLMNENIHYNHSIIAGSVVSVGEPFFPYDYVDTAVQYSM